MELFKYYNLTESTNPNLVVKRLEELYDNLKIDYDYYLNEDIVKITDIDLTEDDIKKLQRLFDKYHVLPDLDCGINEVDTDDDDLDDLMGLNEDYDF
jgi:hypothetical protein